MQKIVWIIIFTMIVIVGFGQNDWQGEDRSYTIDMAINGDSLSNQYLVDVVKKDDQKRFEYITESRDSFIYVLSRDLINMPIEKDQIIIYIHGYLGGQSIPLKNSVAHLKERYVHTDDSSLARVISFKWPGNNPIYAVCRENLYNHAPALAKEFFTFCNYIKAEMAELGKPVQIDIMAHSLGGDMYRELVRYHKVYTQDTSIFDQVILAAPDMDTLAFTEDSILDNFHPFVNGTTVYYSNRDVTLTVSKNFNKKNRLGLTGPSECTHVVDNLRFVEVSDIQDTKPLPLRLVGHSYYRASDISTADMLSALEGAVNASYINRTTKSLNNYYLSDKSTQLSN